MKQTKVTAAASLAALVLSGGAALAGTTMAPSKAPVPMAPEPPAPPVVTGTLNLSLNTHFISYGQDVWAAGNEWSDALFNPSIELSFDLGSGFSFVLGTWWDVNDNADSNIGNSIQEIDVWGGFGYTTGKWAFSLVYQQWLYASQTEQILDFKIAYNDDFLNPSLMLHGRLDGADPFDTGLVTVLGIAPGTTAGPVSISFPIQVAADTDGFHGGDGGFSFVSAGVTGSVPLKFLPGEWALNAGVTYYHTEQDVFPGNPDTDFVTGTIGLGLSF